MTYDPDRDTRDPAGATPNRRPYDRARSGAERESEKNL